MQENKTDHVFTWPNGSVDKFIACENLERMKGAEADIILVDQAEELSESTWQFLEGRASGKVMPRSQLCANANPHRQGKSHWLYRMFFERREGTAWRTKTTDNKFLPEDYVKHRLGRLKGRYYQMYVLGEWVGFEGLVYPDYDPLRHVVKPFRLDDSLPRYGAIDFGYTNPAVYLLAAHDPKGVHGIENAVYVYRELYETHLLVSAAPGKRSLASEIRRINAPHPPRQIWADHAAQERAILLSENIPTVPALKDVEPGIAAVSQLLADQPDATGKSVPRLYYFEDMLVRADPLLEMEDEPTSTLHEFGHYIRPAPKEAKNVAEAPIEKRNHGSGGASGLGPALARLAAPGQPRRMAPGDGDLRR
jgi:phage terminase large subunit